MTQLPDWYTRHAPVDGAAERQRMIDEGLIVPDEVLTPVQITGPVLRIDDVGRAAAAHEIRTGELSQLARIERRRRW